MTVLQSATQSITSDSHIVRSTPQCLLRARRHPLVSGRLGVAAPCCAALAWGCASHPDLGWRFRGARFLGRAVGPIARRGSSPEPAVCGWWRHSRGRWSPARGRPVSGHNHDYMEHAARALKTACARPDRGSHAVTSRHDKSVYVQARVPVSPVHLLIDLIVL